MANQEESRSTASDWNGIDDATLIRAYLKGDQLAFEVLFKKYRGHVSNLAYSIVKESSLVDDIVQEVFLSVHRSLPKFRQEASLKTWIYRITVNESLRQVGRLKRWVQLPEGEAEPARLSSTLVVVENGESPERVLLQGEQKAQVQAALDALKPHHRLILTLYYVEDLSVQEIASILEIPEGSVKSRLFYARRSLRDVLDPIMEREHAPELRDHHAM